LEERLIGSKTIRFILYFAYAFVIPFLLNISIDTSSVLMSLVPAEYQEKTYSLGEDSDGIERNIIGN
jgi:hypothetical protein